MRTPAIQRLLNIAKKNGYDTIPEFYGEVYQKRNKSAGQLSREYGESTHFHIKYLKKYGFAVKNPRKKLDVTNKEILSLLDSGISQREVSRKLNMHESTLSNRLYKIKENEETQTKKRKRRICVDCNRVIHGPNYRRCGACVTRLGSHETQYGLPQIYSQKIS